MERVHHWLSVVDVDDNALRAFKLRACLKRLPPTFYDSGGALRPAAVMAACGRLAYRRRRDEPVHYGERCALKLFFPRRRGVSTPSGRRRFCLSHSLNASGPPSAIILWDLERVFDADLAPPPLAADNERPTWVGFSVVNCARSLPKIWSKN